MKTLDLTQDINAIVKRATAFYPMLNKATLRSAGSQLVDAVAEGVKQNFLGPNINMEFLTLSIKAYFLLLISFTAGSAKRVTANYSEKRDRASKEKQSAPALNYCIS
jgi:hypothetical protein